MTSYESFLWMRARERRSCPLCVAFQGAHDLSSHYLYFVLFSFIQIYSFIPIIMLLILALSVIFYMRYVAPVNSPLFSVVNQGWFVNPTCQPAPTNVQLISYHSLARELPFLQFSLPPIISTLAFKWFPGVNEACWEFCLNLLQFFILVRGFIRKCRFVYCFSKKIDLELQN